jgi:hypothetical protein
VIEVASRLVLDGEHRRVLDDHVPAAGVGAAVQRGSGLRTRSLPVDDPSPVFFPDDDAVVAEVELVHLDVPALTTTAPLSRTTTPTSLLRVTLSPADASTRSITSITKSGLLRW